MFLLYLAGAALLVYLGLTAWLWFSQESLLYHPGGDPGPPPPGWREVPFRTADGLELKGWFRPGKPGAGAVLYLHGNAGNRKDALEEAVLFQDSGAALFFPDWRGFGGNPGRPSEEGLYMDGLAALDALAREAGVESSSIVAAGRSLGSAVAVELALRRPLRALILLTPFTSIPDVGASLYPWAPVRLLCRDRFDQLSRAGKLDLPVLIVAAQEDHLAPPSMGRRLAARIRRARFYLVPQAGHGDLVFRGGKALAAEISAFLEANGPGGAGEAKAPPGHPDGGG